VNTKSKYETLARRDVKLEQRTPAYRELQQRAAAERSQLEAKLRERNAVIDRLKKKLVEVGFAADDVAKIAA
jgi:predicted nuclease with TOPRIM domain